MEEKNNKNGLIIGLVVLVIICLVTIVFLFFNIGDTKNIGTSVKNKYSDYSFVDVKIYDKSDNGKIVYTKKDTWLYDTATDNVLISDKCSLEKENANKYLFKINDGILTVTEEKTNESYEFKNITNVKSVMEFFGGMDCTNQHIVILTEDGKIYYRNNSGKIRGNNLTIDFSSIEEEFNLIDSVYKFDEIGYSSYEIYTSLGARTTDGLEVTINDDYTISDPYDTDFYSYLIFSNFEGEKYRIKVDASLTNYDGNNFIVDEKGNKIYINYGFYNYDLLYIIDRQGNLYTLNGMKAETIVTKYGNEKVESIGIKTIEDNKFNIVLMLTNSKVIEIETNSKFGID